MNRRLRITTRESQPMKQGKKSDEHPKIHTGSRRRGEDPPVCFQGSAYFFGDWISISIPKRFIGNMAKNQLREFCLCLRWVDYHGSGC